MALAIVLAVIGAAVWAVRRFLPAARTGDSGVLRVVARVSLSPKHSVALISVGRRFVMVGLSGDRLMRVCQVTDPEEVAELAARTGSLRTGNEQAFDTLLARDASDYHESFDLGTATETERSSDRPVNGKRAQNRDRKGAGQLNALLGKLRKLQTR